MDTSKMTIEFIQKNSLDGGFLQSPQWRKFQKNAGRETYLVEDINFTASIIQHLLPIVGKYFYVPRGPVIDIKSQKEKIKNQMQKLIKLAKDENAGWIRIEPVNDKILNLIKENISEKIVRAPHDMQPKEIFLLDVKKPSEQLLREMKSKTRYNIGVAKKKKVTINSYVAGDHDHNEYLNAFLKLTKEMALRNGISSHPDVYYRKMFESFPKEMLKIYVASFEGETIAANLVLFNGEYATYVHGASGNSHRNVMAPFLLQWQTILDAKESGCKFYDFGGVQSEGVNHQKHSDLSGVTNFKTGFSTVTRPVEFPGSFDIIINPRAYALYRGLQKAKSIVSRFRK